MNVRLEGIVEVLGGTHASTGVMRTVSMNCVLPFGLLGFRQNSQSLLVLCFEVVLFKSDAVPPVVGCPCVHFRRTCLAGGLRYSSSIVSTFYLRCSVVLLSQSTHQVADVVGRYGLFVNLKFSILSEGFLNMLELVGLFLGRNLCRASVGYGQDFDRFCQRWFAIQWDTV